MNFSIENFNILKNIYITNRLNVDLVRNISLIHYRQMYKICIEDNNIDNIKYIEVNRNYRPYIEYPIYLEYALDKKYYDMALYYIDNNCAINLTNNNNVKAFISYLIKSNNYNMIIKIVEKNLYEDSCLFLLTANISLKHKNIELFKKLFTDLNFIKYMDEKTSIEIIKIIHNIYCMKYTYASMELMMFVLNKFNENNYRVHLNIINFSCSLWNKNFFNYSIDSCELIKLMLPYGYFDTSLRKYYSESGGLSLKTAKLDETYIKYLLDKKIVNISDNNYIIFSRLLLAKKTKFFIELYEKYGLPDNVKKEIIFTILYDLDVFTRNGNNDNNEYYTILHKILKDFGYNFNEEIYVDVHTKTQNLLLLCVQYYNLELVKLLINHGADINFQDGRVLRRAIYYKRMNIIKYLLEQPNIIINNTHFTKKQFNYLLIKNLLTEEMMQLFDKYNPSLFVNKSFINKKLVYTCSINNDKNNQVIRFLLSKNADITVLGKPQKVFNHPIYKKNEYILEEYAKYYFAVRKIYRIMYGRRGIMHNISFKLGRKRVLREFMTLEEMFGDVNNKKCKLNIIRD